MWLTAIGSAYFWFLGALLQMDLILFGKNILGADDVRVGLLQTFLAVGIGVGSLAAGRLSGRKVELGLVPLGALGIGVSALLLALLPATYAVTAGLLVTLGFAGGLYIVPLHAFIQQKSGAHEKGRVVATTNFMSTLGILLASGMLWVSQSLLGMSADQVLLVFGIGTLLGTVYAMFLLPDFLVRFCLWSLTHTLYRIRIVGQTNVPQNGPALLICNHVSFVDGFLVGACIQRFVRFIVYQGFYHHPMLNWLFRLTQAIPIAGGDPVVVAEALDQARTALREGHVVCIFAEGAISRTGNLLPFKRGFERIIEGLDVPIIPVHLDRVWGSIFSFKDGRFLWKWPRQLPYPITVSFGSPLPPTTTADQARQTIMELSCDAVEHRRTRRDLLHLRFITNAKRRWRQWAMADSTGKTLTYGQSLVGSLLLARWLRRHHPNETMVGLVLPNSVGGATANIGVLLSGKVPVNLNFAAGRDAMANAAAQCELRTILTSRTFLHKAEIAELTGMVDLDTVMSQLNQWQKVMTYLTARITPARLLRWRYTGSEQRPESLATVLFSSGSTGDPKGVMLSHHNMLSNIEGMMQVFDLLRQDRMMGVLPFFHAFGSTATLWFPLITGCSVVYHANPLDSDMIGTMVQRHRATLLLSTPALCERYLRECAVADFESLRYAVVGAARCRPELATAFKAKYGVDILEGYGCTEMGPVVAVNVPDVTLPKRNQVGNKAGTVGHPLPGVATRIVHPDTGAELPSNTEGLLWVKGPSQMMGYWQQPAHTAEVLRDGWYLTGDIAAIDEDGFIRLADRCVTPSDNRQD